MRKTILCLATLLALVSACPSHTLSERNTVSGPIIDFDPSRAVTLKVPVTTQSVAPGGTGHEQLTSKDRIGPGSPGEAGSSEAASERVATADADALPTILMNECPGKNEYGKAYTEDEGAARDSCTKQFESCCDLACKSAGYLEAMDDPIDIIPEMDEKSFDLPTLSSGWTYCGCICKPKLVVGS